jgi:hypothetical protein
MNGSVPHQQRDVEGQRKAGDLLGIEGDHRQQVVDRVQVTRPNTPISTASTTYFSSISDDAGFT